MKRNRTTSNSNFAIVPTAQMPRSKFPIRQTRKQAFNASELIPIMCEEVLPGDTWQHNEAIMARLATPIAPAVDDIDLETFYFFHPDRIAWPDWEDFITGVNTELNVPLIQPVDGATNTLVANGLLDHFGLLPQAYAPGAFGVNAMPIWMYFNIYNQWFRDQNLQQEWEWPTDEALIGTDDITQNGVPWNQMCLRANKRSDYFTRSLPWPQKGPAVQLPLGTTAPVEPISPTSYPQFVQDADPVQIGVPGMANASGNMTWFTPGSPYTVLVGSGQERAYWYESGLQTNLAAATAATINSMRLASTIQRLLERDARGGSRYVENILAHWGVHAPNYMLQIPEYLGGSKIPITVNPIAQTASYDAIPDEASALGNLGAEMHANGSRRTFTYAAVEHGYIIGVAVVRATPTYQQGSRRHWGRKTRLDFWDPIYEGLGEQAVNTWEIWQATNATYTNPVWGYQERGGEYRYFPNEITGVLRSTAPEPLDWWHYSEEFGGEPALNAAFITDKTQETLARSLATAPSEQWSAQIIMDIQHTGSLARLMPAYGVPGIKYF